MLWPSHKPLLNYVLNAVLCVCDITVFALFMLN